MNKASKEELVAEFNDMFNKSLCGILVDYKGMTVEQITQLVESGIAPSVVADHVIRAVRENRLYILTHPEFNSLIQRRFRKILS